MKKHKKNKEEACSVRDAMKVPKRELPFKNKCWSYINNLVNSKNEGSNTLYNDMLMFEKHFEEWDFDGILLLELSEDAVDNIPYVYIRPIGVFTNLNNLGRRLQNIFSERGYKDISVMMTGDELDFTVRVDGKRYKTYNLRCIEIDQRSSQRYYAGLKYDIISYELQYDIHKLVEYVEQHLVDKGEKVSIADAINRVIEVAEEYAHIENLKKSPGRSSFDYTTHTTLIRKE